MSLLLCSLPKEATYLAQSSNISNSTQFYTQASAGSQYNDDDNFMKQARVISLADMKKLKTVCFCRFPLFYIITLILDFESDLKNERGSIS
jgi:hypothetical protein